MGQGLNQLPHLPDLCRVEAVGGFVQDHHRRFVDDRLRQPHSLLIALGELTDETLAHRLQFALLLDPLAAFPGLLAIEAAQPGAVGEVFIDGLVPEQRRAFGQKAESRLGLQRALQQILATDAHSAATGRQVATKHAQDGRLAGAVRTEQAQDIPRLQLQVEGLDHLPAVETALKRYCVEKIGHRQKDTAILLR